MPAVDRQRARAAKKHLVADLGSSPLVNGIGITPVRGGYAIKVNLLRASSSLEVPTEFDGVDVQVEVVGPGFPQAG